MLDMVVEGGLVRRGEPLESSMLVVLVRAAEVRVLGRRGEEAREEG